MKIRDLALPVKAVKTDWVPATLSFDFTPKDESINARAVCQSTVAGRAHNAYVVEYIVKNMERPNPGFENDPDYLQDVEGHASLAGRLIAVHRIRPSARPQREIIGDSAYERLQDMWARGGKRYRWSVAFPIIESFDIIDPPEARTIFGLEAYLRLFAHPSGALRPLDELDRQKLAELALKSRPTKNAWIAIEDEAEMAARSQIDPRISRDIDHDLANTAMEGLTKEQKLKFRRRAAWLADRFVRDRQKAQKLICDDCGFDPAARAVGTKVSPRSLIDVHHIRPLAEGQRYTTTSDFKLLCPNCHRFAHAMMRVV